MNYEIIQRTNPQNREQTLFYPTPVWSKEISEDELAEEISYASSINDSDVRAVIASLIAIMPRHMMNGESIRLGKLGIFKLSFESTGSEKAEDVSAHNITRTKVMFKPGSVVKNKINSTSYSKKKQ